MKIEDALQARDIALKHFSKKGFAIFSREIESIKKLNGKWLIQINSDTLPNFYPKIEKLEIDSESGNIII